MWLRKPPLGPPFAPSTALVCSNLPLGTSYSVIAPFASRAAIILPSGENRMGPPGRTTPGSGRILRLGALVGALAYASLKTAWRSGLINPRVAGEPGCLLV